MLVTVRAYGVNTCVVTLAHYTQCIRHPFMRLLVQREVMMMTQCINF